MYSLYFYNVLLTVHRNISVQQDQQDALFALVYYDQQTVHGSSTIWPSSGGTVCTAVGIFCVCCVGWLLERLEWNK
jgi:hypothetical protein